METPSGDAENDRLPYGEASLPKKGDPTQEVTYAAVGYALSQWENMETHFCWTLAGLLKKKRYTTEIIRIYSAQPTFTGRIKTVEAALNKVPIFDQEFAGCIYSFITEASDLANIRNNITHAIVILLRASPVYPNAPLLYTYTPEYCLVPAYYNHRHVDSKMRPKYIYVAPQIVEFGKAFANLGERIWRFNLRYFQEIWSP